MISIGYIGKFEFNSPVNNVLDGSLEYEVTSIVKITEMFINESKPYETIYTPLGISKDLYNIDFVNNINIIGIRGTNSNDYIYVPESFIASTPINTGVKYVEKIIAINLGKVPVEMDLSNLYSRLKDTVMEQTNLDVEIASINNSGIELVSDTDHTIYMNKVNNLGSRTPTYKELYYTLAEKYEKLWKVAENLNGAINVEVLENNQ